MMRIIFLTLLVVAIAACSMHGNSTVLPSVGQPLLRAPQSAPVDVGRRAARDPVSVVLLLRYNHQAELDRFVNALVHTRSPHYLTASEFIERFAPTVAQQERVLQLLRRAGFTITHTYPNRTLVDASAPSATVERLFSTQIHNYRQPRYGIRFANVRPLRVPAELATLVAAVTADTVVRRRPGLVTQSEPELVPDSKKNILRNPNFKTGKLHPWTTCRTYAGTPDAQITKAHPHSGKYDAFAGALHGESEPDKIDAVCQLVTIPNDAQLTAWTWGVDSDRSHKVYQFGALLNNYGAVKTFFRSRTNDDKWASRGPYDLSSFAGQTLYLAFGIVGDSSDKGKFIGQYLGGASLGSVHHRTTPPPSPTPSPTPTPALPCLSSPSAMPTPNTNPNTNGWGPASVADAIDMPSNYFCTGAGETAAIVIDTEVNPSDLTTYLQSFAINQTGTVSYELLNGATASYDTDGEASLDLETISGLAPAANVIVYVLPELDDEDIEDAYEQVLKDGKASAVNSSFGGCETNDPSFAEMVDGIAEGAVTKGVTFSASSGDQGADCYAGTDFPFGVNAPASAPHFVAVGGTQSESPAMYCEAATSIVNPAVWNDCIGSGGGGISTVFAEPSWQSGISGASTSGRNVPDIALPAATDALYCTGCGGGWFLVWGTSWASPMYVAMQIEINQICGNQWGINTLYNALPHSSTDFIDVINGNNDWNSHYNTTPTKYYSAAKGFDNVSGIGIPLGMPLAQSECNK
jgi:hypothetical protein